MTTTLHRLAKFSLVGLLGTTVQLLTLAALNRALPTHYLINSALALELTLLHNFLWHLRYTWRDHRPASLLETCLRFHAANGLVSLIGNLAFMAVLVRHAHMPPIPANLIAIVCCSAANFTLSHRWTFKQPLSSVARTLPSLLR